MTRRKQCLAKDNKERRFREAAQRGNILKKKKKKKQTFFFFFVLFSPHTFDMTHHITFCVAPNNVKTPVGTISATLHKFSARHGSTTVNGGESNRL
jgi:hypothetical protein